TVVRQPLPLMVASQRGKAGLEQGRRAQSLQRPSLPGINVVDDLADGRMEGEHALEIGDWQGSPPRTYFYDAMRSRNATRGPFEAQDFNTASGTLQRRTREFGNKFRVDR